MRSVVLIPGAAPHWVDDHARHLAQRLTDVGRVMVIFTRDSRHRATLPGRPGSGSVLGHSVAGYPIWTGRLRAAFGLRRSARALVIVLWPEANHAIALWAALMARLRGEQVVLDIPQRNAGRPSFVGRILRRPLCALANEVVEGRVAATDDGTRLMVALCGDDAELVHLVLQTFDGMSDAAAASWRLHVQVDAHAPRAGRMGGRRDGKVTIVAGEPSLETLRDGDVLIAAFDSPFEGLVHQAVLSGGAGVIVGQPVAGRVARCHDGVWLAQRNSASILVALESSSGVMFERPGSVADLRELANDVIKVVDRQVLA